MWLVQWRAAACRVGHNRVGGVWKGGHGIAVSLPVLPPAPTGRVVSVGFVHRFVSAFVCSSPLVPLEIVSCCEWMWPAR